MPPKKWGTTLNKSYGGGGKSGGATSVIAQELSREAQHAAAPPAATSAADASSSANSKTSSSVGVAMNIRPNPNHSQKSPADDPRNAHLREAEVRSSVRRKISDNNMLGLPVAEIDSMVDLILAASSKKEIFDWCTTLLLSERDAVEIIHLRESNRIGCFADSAVPPIAAVPNVAPLPSTAPPQAAPQTAAAPSKNEKSSDSTKPLPSLQSLNQKHKAKSDTSTSSGGGAAGSGSKILSVGKNGVVAPLNNTAAQPVVGSGTKKRGANAKALANLSHLGGNSLVVGQFFECGCFAVTHNFISNCLNCGRIFCEQEMPNKTAAVGSYAARAGGVTAESIMCYACGQDPNRNITFEIKVQQGLVDQLAADKTQKGFEEAVERRDQLLQYARERSKRTTVVDDQGVGGIAYGTNTAWMSEEEVEKMEDQERKRRIAEMHKHTGAYRVHLDIVNQSVCLGAVPSGPSAEEEEAAAQKKKDEEAAAAEKVKMAGVNAWGVVASTRPLGGEENGVDEMDDDDGADDPYDDEEEGARRVLPLPTLLQKLWYTSDENANVANAASQKNGGGKWDASRVSTADEAGAGGSAASAAVATLASQGPTVLDLKPTTHRGIIASKRVQNDYFEDDDLAYRVEREDFIFRMKRALLEEEEEAEEAKRRGIPISKKSGSKAKGTESAAGKTSSGAGVLSSSPATTGGASSSPPTSTPAVDRESFFEHGIGSSQKADIASSNKIGAAMAAGGRIGDEGMCMSMHQPWASLLVSGIKMHEGRTWPSDFKGRLWIHAAAAKYSENEIEAIENQHREFLRANNIAEGKKFPTNYPTSCLLGYVNVSEVISKAEYNERFPDPNARQELGDSGYVFMCENGAKMLPFTLPMEGKHKIYKLDRKVWGAARKQFGEE